MRRLVSEIKADTGLTASVGIGPNRLVAKVASDAEKPAGLRRAHARAGVRALRRRRRRGCCPASAPKTAERLEAARDRHDRAARGDAAGDAGRALRRPHGPVPAARARASRTTRPVSSERIAVSESRETTFHDRHRRPRRAGRGAAPARRRSCARAWPSTSAAGARSPSRSGSTTSRRSPAPARSRWPPTTPRWSPTSPARCSTSTRRRGRCGCSACAWRPSRRARADEATPQMTLAL